jgi:hypothetical protein
MIFAILYVVAGSVTTYFMQSHIRWFTDLITTYQSLQTILNIVFDAIIGTTWIVSAPALCAFKIYYQQKKRHDNVNR